LVDTTILTSGQRAMKPHVNTLPIASRTGGGGNPEDAVLPTLSPDAVRLNLRYIKADPPATMDGSWGVAFTSAGPAESSYFTAASTAAFNSDSTLVAKCSDD
jgi:hypothetical protein